MAARLPDAMVRETAVSAVVPQLLVVAIDGSDGEVCQPNAVAVRPVVRVGDSAGNPVSVLYDANAVREVKRVAAVQVVRMFLCKRDGVSGKRRSEFP